ncbi:tellurium resistance protein [Planktotalea sp.]|uniref:SLAC1 family transporter n=1 Tax=Planktotalea sp. TaxID=2029877 RepID=UPI0032978C54
MSHPDQDPSATPPTAQVAEFWRRTPPALFPAVMGLMGLGLAWRFAAGAEPLSISIFVSNVILAFASVLFFFLLSCYLSKLSVRPAVIMEELVSVPGRSGVSGMSLSCMLFAAAVFPLSPIVSNIALFAGMAGHATTALLTILVMARLDKGFVVSPVWHLTFVGVIVASLSAIPLGYFGLATFLLGITIFMAVLVYGVSLLQLSKAEMPAPLRPLLVVHLAPLSLFTGISAQLGYNFMALFFGTLAIGVAAVIVSRIRYIAVAGFSPLWGAFTFPVAAFTVALFSLSDTVPLFAWIALIPLAVATLTTPLIVVRVLIMWSTGALAAKTGAAIA